MAIDGKYNLELQTTVGAAAIGLTLKAEGSSLSGNIDGHFGAQSFSGGIVKGDELAWTVKLQSPMGEMSLAVKATVKGNQIEGQVQLGSFRPSFFIGKRA